jgi:hypothetical protein
MGRAYGTQDFPHPNLLSPQVTPSQSARPDIGLAPLPWTGSGLGLKRLDVAPVRRQFVARKSLLLKPVFPDLG